MPLKRTTTRPKTYLGSEQSLQNAIITYLQHRHFWVMRVNSGMIKTESGGMVKLAMKGVPDVLAIKYGMAYWFEIKLPGKTSTPIQKARQDELRAAGCQVFEIHSLEEMQKVA